MASARMFVLLCALLAFDFVHSQGGPVANFPITDCGRNGGKQCIGAPEPTCVTSGICTFLAKYSYDPLTSPDQVRIELFGIPPMAGSSNFWIALGLNHVTGSMAGTLVNECIYNNGQVDVFTSYNSDGYVNRRTAPSPKLGIALGNGSLSNGVLGCTITLDRVRQWNNMDFNLTQPLFVILGHGAADNWNLRYHVTTPTILNNAVALATVNSSPTVYPNLQSLNTIAPTFEASQSVNTNSPTSGGASSPAVVGVRSGVMPAGISSCGTTKGCLGNPANCMANPLTCTSIVSYQQDPDRSDLYRMELWRQMGGQGDQYVAVGLSNTSPGMAGANVLGCVNFGGRMDVIKSYNPGYYNTPIENPYEGLTTLQVASDGTNMYCQFNVEKKLLFRTSSNAGNIDLNNPTFMMVAHGPANQQGGLRKHETTPLATSAPVQMSSIASARLANKDLLKAHAGLMAGAWMFLASLGILTARHYKNMWLSHQPCGLKLWFHVHRPVMILVASASIAAFVIIFVHVGQWTATPITENPHPAIGMVAFILAVIQPIMALFRCHPGTPNRPIFNWAHFFVGFSAHILAIAAVLLGLRMPQLNISPVLRETAFWIVVAYAAFHALWLILLQLIDWIAPRTRRSTQSTTVQMKTMNGNGTVHQETVTTTTPADPAGRLKTAMWFIHLIIVAGLTTAVLVIIGTSGD